MNNTIFLKETYELATNETSGRLLIDLDPKTLDSLCFFKNIEQPGPKFFNLTFLQSGYHYIDRWERKNYVC